MKSEQTIAPPENSARNVVTSLFAGAVWVGILSLAIPAGGEGLPGDLLLDRNSTIFPYPFTIQNVMWLVFFVAAGQLVRRYLVGEAEQEQLRRRLLPQDDETMLRQRDIGGIFRRVQQSDPTRRYWMQRLLTVAMLQFQASGSTDQVYSAVNCSMKIYQQETDLRYSVPRFLVWVIRTLGFVGIVLGIAFALSGTGVSAAVSMNPGTMERQLIGQLLVALYTPLLALVLSSVLVLSMNLIQACEKTALNRVGEHCINNFVNRLYEKRT